MCLLRHLCEVTSLAMAHRDLSVMSFHVSVHNFCGSHSFAIDTPEHFFKAVIDTIYVVRSTVLNR